MKLIDIINENEDKDKIIKRGKTVYKALKTGVIRKGHFGKIMYELPDVYNVQLDHSDDIFIKVGKNRSDNEIKFFYVDGSSGEIRPYSLNHSEYKIFVKEINTHKFQSFDIELWYDQSVDMDQPINEEADNNLTPKDRKKANLIYKTFKTGKYQVDDMTYRYELPDEYWLSNDDESGNPVVVLTMHPEQKMKLYSTMTNWSGEKHEFPVDTQYSHLYRGARERIEKKFQQFNVDIVF